MKIQSSRPERAFQAFNYILLTLLGLIMLYPFWEIIKVSFSDPLEVGRSGYRIWPLKSSLEGYIHVFKNEFVWLGYKNTIFRVIVAMSVQMALMILTAYPLSKRNLPNRNVITMFIVFTMLFNGGLIPEYLLVVNTLHLDNSIWALSLPAAINTFSMLILRNFFMTIPTEMEESAKIDGASDLWILVRIILPLSMSVLVTVLLWGIVQNWNAWFDCIIYIRDYKKYVLQAVLRKIVIDASPELDRVGALEETIPINAEVVKASTIVVSTLPIMMIYPFVQKFFIRGVMIGSLKG
jgi:putative aldouronate transport system permease protein